MNDQKFIIERTQSILDALGESEREGSACGDSDLVCTARGFMGCMLLLLDI